ncbi:uncharacterized protein [Ambystoma mexicanum]|uniref:uncharacterized protein n=1 Tax=Ambystoma mexicanum TaxID=8296 RepID=UPI0037E9A84C
MQENDTKLISRLKVKLDGASEQEKRLRAELEVCQKDMQSKCNEFNTLLSQRRTQFEDSEQELKYLKGFVSHIRQDKEKAILEMQVLQRENLEKEVELQTVEQEIAKMFQERDKWDKKFNECQIQMSDMQNVINKMGDENTYLHKEADRPLKKCEDLEQQMCDFRSQDKQQRTTFIGIEVNSISTLGNSVPVAVPVSGLGCSSFGGFDSHIGDCHQSHTTETRVEPQSNAIPNIAPSSSIKIMKATKALNKPFKKEGECCIEDHLEVPIFKALNIPKEHMLRALVSTTLLACGFDIVEVDLSKMESIEKVEPLIKKTLSNSLQKNNQAKMQAMPEEQWQLDYKQFNLSRQKHRDIQELKEAEQIRITVKMYSKVGEKMKKMKKICCVKNKLTLKNRSKLNKLELQQKTLSIRPI